MYVAVAQSSDVISGIGYRVSFWYRSNPTRLTPFKGELNPNNKLDLNDSFSTRINKYNPHTVQFCVV